MNAYEGKVGMVYVHCAGKTCDPCLTALKFKIYIVYKWRCVNTLSFLSFPYGISLQRK